MIPRTYGEKEDFFGNLPGRSFSSEDGTPHQPLVRAIDELLAYRKANPDFHAKCFWPPLNDEPLPGSGVPPLVGGHHDTFAQKLMVSISNNVAFLNIYLFRE